MSLSLVSMSGFWSRAILVPFATSLASLLLGERVSGSDSREGSTPPSPEWVSTSPPSSRRRVSFSAALFFFPSFGLWRPPMLMSLSSFVLRCTWPRQRRRARHAFGWQQQTGVSPTSVPGWLLSTFCPRAEGGSRQTSPAARIVEVGQGK